MLFWEYMRSFNLIGNEALLIQWSSPARPGEDSYSVSREWLDKWNEGSLFPPCMKVNLRSRKEFLYLPETPSNNCNWMWVFLHQTMCELGKTLDKPWKATKKVQSNIKMCLASLQFEVWHCISLWHTKNFLSHPNIRRDVWSKVHQNHHWVTWRSAR
jgi:hypothetical protein